MLVGGGAATLDDVADPRCPSCRTPPPALVACDACEEAFAPFVTAGACPRCANVWDRLACLACDAWTRLELWLPEAAERAAFVERLLGPREGGWAGAAWRKTTRVLGADVMALVEGGLPADEEEQPDPAAARADVLAAEGALARARTGEEEIAALLDQDRSAVSAESEAARRASRAAVDAAARALEEARARAVALARRQLPADRADPGPVAPPLPGSAGRHEHRCPRCAWRGDGRPRWVCSRCRRWFDAVGHGGTCPACERRRATIHCPACGSPAPPEAWGIPARPCPAPTPTAASPLAPARWLVQRLGAALDASGERGEQAVRVVGRTAELADRAFVGLVQLVGKGVDAAQGMDEGRTCFDAGDWEGVVAECSAALRLRPANAGALSRRGSARRMLDQDELARQDLDAALALDHASPASRAWTLRERALLRWTLEDFAGVVRDASEAVALDPDDVLGHRLRGDARWELGELDEAVVDLDQAVRRSKRSRRQLVHRARLHLERRAWAAAEADLTEAIERGLHVPWAYCRRATARLHQGRPDDAADDAGRALRLDPVDATALLTRSHARASGGAPALLDLPRLRRLDPTGRSTGVWWSLALEAYFAGDRGRARAYLRDELDEAVTPTYSALWLSLLLGEDDALPAAAEGWPGQLVRFARGELEPGALLAEAAAGAETERLGLERLCEAHGFIGLQHERAGRLELAFDAYRACVATHVWSFKEHFWASLRLAGVTSRPPRPAPAPAPDPAPVSLAAQLERLGRLRAQGVLTDDEFTLAKRRLLGL